MDGICAGLLLQEGLLKHYVLLFSFLLTLRFPMLGIN